MISNNPTSSFLCGSVSIQLVQSEINLYRLDYILEMKGAEFYLFVDFFFNRWTEWADRSAARLYARREARCVSSSRDTERRCVRSEGEVGWGGSALGDSLPFRVASFCNPTGHEYQAERTEAAAGTQRMETSVLETDLFWTLPLVFKYRIKNLIKYHNKSMSH